MLNRYLSKKDIEMANRYMQRCSTLLILEKYIKKETKSYHLIPVRMTIIKKQEVTSLGKDVETGHAFALLVGM